MGKGAERRKRQKAQHVFDYQIKPAVEKIEEDLPTIQWLMKNRVIDPIVELKCPGGVEKLVKLQARLQDPSVASNPDAQQASKKLTADTAASQPPNGYYVIIGCGAAAVVNHTTLRQSDEGRERLKDPTSDEEEPLPVVHLGYNDPWRHYHKHGMGQPPYLLQMPGYHKPVGPDAEDVRSGLSSLVFAQSTKDELDLLVEKFETYCVKGYALILESQGQRGTVTDAMVDLGLSRSKLQAMLDMEFPATYPTYRILVVIDPGDMRFLYAHKVDICSGAGVMNLTPRNVSFDALPAAWKKAATKPWMPPEKWGEGTKQRSIVHGMDGLTEELPWRSTDRVCVLGAGGIGLNQVERAEDVDNALDWYGPRTLHQTFVLKRNDTVLRSLGGTDAMEPGDGDAMRTSPTDFDTAFRLIPASKKWRFAQNANIDAAKVTESKKKVLPPIVTNVSAEITDFHEKDVKADPEGYFPYSTEYEQDNPASCQKAPGGKAYDRLVVCIGQVQDGPGQAKSLAEGFTVEPIDYHGRMVGLKADGGNIRVLGGASVMFPGMNKKPLYENMETFRQSLPASTVPPGFILAGHNIAAANGFFDEAPNRNANTASRDEMVELIRSDSGSVTKVDAEKIADAIVDARKWPYNGVPDRVQFENLIDTQLVVSGEAKTAAKNQLGLVYRAADDWSSIK